jgi:predicted nucleotidyltransferase
MISNILAYKSNVKIIKLFSLAPGKCLSRKTIKEFTKLSNIALDNSMGRLVREGILKKEKRTFRLSLSDEKTQVILNILKKEQELLREIPYSVWIILFDFSAVMEKTDFKRVILFGSYAKHIASSTSDIDIALVSKEKDTKQEFKAEEIADELEKKYRKRIQLHYLLADEFEKCKMEIVKEIKKEGIVT